MELAVPDHLEEENQFFSTIGSNFPAWIGVITDAKYVPVTRITTSEKLSVSYVFEKIF